MNFRLIYERHAGDKWEITKFSSPSDFYMQLQPTLCRHTVRFHAVSFPDVRTPEAYAERHPFVE